MCLSKAYVESSARDGQSQRNPVSSPEEIKKGEVRCAYQKYMLIEMAKKSF